MNNEINQVFRNIKEIKDRIHRTKARLEEVGPELKDSLKAHIEWNQRNVHTEMALYNHLAGMVIFDEVKGCSCDFCYKHPAHPVEKA